MQGQSLSTIDKERKLAAALALELLIVQKFCRNDIYRHIDLNAGCGWNSDYGVKGSPLVFIELADLYLGKRWEATFYEINESLAQELWTRLRGIPRCTVLPLDNKHFRERARHFPRNAVGSVLADPNGWLFRSEKGIGDPVEEMVQFFAAHRRMDLIANLNVRFYKQAKGNARKYPAKFRAFQRMHGLEELPRVFSKGHGLISDLCNHGGDTFVRIVLRNLKFGDWRAQGWYHWNAEIAKGIFRYAETTAADRNDQLSLELEPA